MSARGLSHLLVSIMAAGDVAALQVADLRLAHGAVVRLAQDGSPSTEAVLQKFAVSVRTSPDPAVGLRVAGLTESLIDALREGLVVAREDGPDAWYALPPEQLRRLRAEVAGLDDAQARVLYEVGAAWARSSTSRKNRRTSASPRPRVLASSR